MENSAILNVTMQYQPKIAFSCVKGMFLVPTVTSAAKADAMVV